MLAPMQESSVADLGVVSLVKGSGAGIGNTQAAEGDY